MYHGVHLKNVQLEADKYEKSVKKAELVRSLYIKWASEKGSQSAQTGFAKGHESSE